MVSPEAAALIGGRWAVSLRLFVIAAPLLLASQVMFLAPGPSSPPATQVAAASLLSLVAVGLVLWLADATVLRRRRAEPVPVATVAMVGACAGIARSVTGTLVTDVLTHASLDWRLLTGRTLGAAAVGAVLLPLGAWAIASVDHYRTRRRELLEELTAHELRIAMTEASVAAIRATVAASAQEQLRTVTDALRTQAAQSSADTDAMAKALVHAAEGTVRPMSHRLWSLDVPVASGSWRDSMRIARQLGKMPMVPLAVLLAAATGPREIAMRGLGAGLLVTLLVTLTSVCAIGLLRLVPPSRRTWTAIVGALVLPCVALAAIGSYLTGSSFATSVPGALAVYVALVAMVTAALLATAASAHGATALEAIEHSIAAAEVMERTQRALLVEAQREVAAVIHTQVQGALIAAASAVASSDGTTSEVWLDQLLDTLPALVAADGKRPTTLARVCEEWDGLMEVRSATSAPMDSATEVRIAAIAHEALLNAFRHGDARCASIAVIDDADGWSLTVAADGISPPDDPTRGLGLQRIGILAQSWSLDPGVAGGSVLQAFVAR